MEVTQFYAVCIIMQWLRFYFLSWLKREKPRDVVIKYFRGLNTGLFGLID